MSTEPDSTSDSIPSWLEAAFLASYHSSADPRTLETYQSQFPGYEDEIRALHSQVAGEDLPEVETCLGRYRLVRELGRGGQGVVYLAHDPDLKRDVAIKVLRDRDLFGPGRARMRWSREQQLAARIDHPFVCPILEFGTAQGRSYSVYPYVRGHSLRDLISVARAIASDERADVDPELRARADGVGLLAGARRDPAAKREAVERLLGFWSKLAEATCAIHEQEIVHRDLKPANVLVREDGDPIILDLGLARDESEDRMILTQEGERLGTPAYMAPEQLLDERLTVSPAADMWALGVIFYECLMLRRPFEAPTREALYRNILEASPDPVGLDGGHRATQLRIVLETLLAKEPERRYRTAADLAEDLRRIRAREPILASAPSLFERSLLWARRKPLLAASLAGLAASVIALAVFVALLLVEKDRAERLRSDKQAALRHIATEMLLDIQIQLGKLPGTLPLRKRMFDKALAYLVVLEKDSVRDAGLYRDLLEAHLGLGDVIGYPVNPNLGDPEQALAQFERALALTRELERDRPAGIDAIDIQRYYARAHRKIASTLFALQRTDDVRAHFDAALAASERIQRDPAVLREDRDRHIAILGQLASTSHELGRTEDALRFWTRADRLSRALVSEYPHNADIVANHAATILIRCSIDESSHAPDHAASMLLGFRGTIEEALREAPSHNALNHYLVVFTTQAARLLLASGHDEDAFREFERAMELQAERERREPGNEMSGRLGLKFAMQYSNALLQRGSVDRGLDVAETTLERGLALARRFPGSAELRRSVGMIADYLCDYYAHAAREADRERIRALVTGLDRGQK